VRKQSLEVVTKEKNKKKDLLEKYLELYEKKENDLIKTLCEKLKLCDNFIKNFKF
jgi:hypothetical protein